MGGAEFQIGKVRQCSRGSKRAAQPEGCATKPRRGAVAEERQSGDWRSQGGAAYVVRMRAALLCAAAIGCDLSHWKTLVRAGVPASEAETRGCGRNRRGWRCAGRSAWLRLE